MFKHIFWIATFYLYEHKKKKKLLEEIKELKELSQYKGEDNITLVSYNLEHIAKNHKLEDRIKELEAENEELKTDIIARENTLDLLIFYPDSPEALKIKEQAKSVDKS